MYEKKNYPPKKCCICGAEFIPFRANVRACDNPECKKAARKERQLAWYRANYGAVMEEKRAYMRRSRAANKPPGPHVRKPDTIVAIGYAERQMAASLKAAGKVKVEL